MPPTTYPVARSASACTRERRPLADGAQVELPIGRHDEHLEPPVDRRDERLEELLGGTPDRCRDGDGVVAVPHLDAFVLVQAELDPRPLRGLAPPASFAELLGEQREREQAPREIDVAGEEERRLARDRQIANAQDERVDRARELVAPLLRVQVRGDRLHGAVVDVELAVRVAPGRDEQQRAAPRAVQLGLVELHRLSREVGEHRQRVAELARVDADEHVCDRIGHG